MDCYGRFLVSNSQLRYLFFITVTCFLVLIWRTDLWYKPYYFLPQEPGRLPHVNNGKNKRFRLPCQPLLKAARAILDGERIVLPFNEKKTLWQFKSRVAMNDLVKNINVLLANSTTRPATNKIPRLRKARKVLITFGSNCCWYSKRRAVHKARSVGGFQYAKAFGMDDLSSKFRENYIDSSSSRGAGYWVWKPYILLKVLVENLRENDVVIYQDAGAYFIRSAHPLFRLAAASESGVVVFGLTPSMLERKYTRKDAMMLMDMDVAAVHHSIQRMASFVVLRKTCSSVQFVMEWLAYLTDRRITSDDENELGLTNAETFKDHRHDQSVLSMLSKKWGLPSYRDPSQYGNVMIDVQYGPYQQLFQHDRNKH